MQQPIYVNDTRGALYKDTETSHQIARQNTEHENWHWELSLEMKTQHERKTRYETKISTLKLKKTKVSLEHNM